jgi:hypothetical protein
LTFALSTRFWWRAAARATWRARARRSRLLQGTVHSLDLSIGPRMIWLCEPMIDPVLSTEQIEHMGSPFFRWARTVLRQIAELNAVVGENRVDCVGDDRDQVLQKRGLRSLMLKELTTGRRRIGIRNRTWLSHGHPIETRGRESTCLRSTVETYFVLTASFAMGTGDTSILLVRSPGRRRNAAVRRGNGY